MRPQLVDVLRLTSGDVTPSAARRARFSAALGKRHAMVVRARIERATFPFSGERSYLLSYLTRFYAVLLLLSYCRTPAAASPRRVLAVPSSHVGRQDSGYLHLPPSGWSGPNGRPARPKRAALPLSYTPSLRSAADLASALDPHRRPTRLYPGGTWSGSPCC
jgi:hypothetical protein